MGVVECYYYDTKTQEEITMPDLLEDFAAFVYATSPTRKNICPVCGAELEENEDGDLKCPECDK